MNKLREFRQRNNMTQSELAKQIGVSQQAIHKYETGEVSPSKKIMTRISMIFSESMDNIFNDISNDTMQVLYVSTDEREIVESLRRLKPEFKEYIIQSINLSLATSAKEN